MKETKTKKGHIVFEVQAEETFKLGGLGICDECYDIVYGTGYLVPVLNNFQCPNCHKEWIGFANYYEEDKEFEEKMANFFRTVLK